MTQLQLVLNLFPNPKEEKSIKDVAAETGIKEPNIRRILGQGAKAGIFKRTAPGTYTINKQSGEELAYLYLGVAEMILPQLLEAGRKFNMVFLDPAYYFPGIDYSGNRNLIPYDFITPDMLGYCVYTITQMLVSEHSHVYLMLSGAPTAQTDMNKYLAATVSAGLNIVCEGTYQKMFKNGKPATNIRGKEAAPERLILLSKSGKADIGEIPSLQMNFKCTRPPVKTSYQTQKAEELYNRLIKQGSHPGNHIADAFTGSGMFGKVGLELKRIVSLIEKSLSAFENHIIPNMEKAFI